MEKQRKEWEKESTGLFSLHISFDGKAEKNQMGKGSLRNTEMDKEGMTHWKGNGTYFLCYYSDLNSP